MGKTYKHFTIEEREQLALMLAAGKSKRKIAKALGRSHTTIGREIRRNKLASQRCYLPCKANSIATSRKSKSCRKFRLKNPYIRGVVHQLLALQWSPETIAGWFKENKPADFSISYEAIYQYIYLEANQFIACLPRRHKKRRRKSSKRKAKKTKIPDRISILDRPEIINQRLEFGHWESDAVVSRQSKYALHVITERKTRFTKITLLKHNSAHLTQRSIKLKLIDLPKTARRSITYDNGSENTQHKKVNDFLGTDSYFCEPYHSWEKGSVENINGLIRRFLPKKTDFSKISERKIANIEFWLNNLPKKCLNFKTPAQAFLQQCGALHD